MIKANFATKVQHQGFQYGRRIKLKAYCVQLLFGRGHVRAKTPQILHQYQRVFLFFEKPDRDKGGKVAVVTVVAQKHLGRRQCRPFSDGVHFDCRGLLV